MSIWSLFYPWGFILQLVAVLHFVRRRPESYWLWIILFGGWLGALVYIIAEVVPDAGLLRGTFRMFPRRQRIHELETIVLDNPAAGNYEELGGLYLEDGKYARARECFDRAISSRTDSPDPFYRRALAALGMGDHAAAVPDLERVVKSDPKYDFHRALGLLAEAYARTGQKERAATTFEQAIQLSTASETQFYYAAFLANQGRTAEAREWAERILSKKRTMPGFQKRRERGWFRKAAGLLKQLPK